MTGIEKYLQPGILEDFCLGLLNDADSAEISNAATTSPALLQKIQEIEKALILYSNTNGSQGLKERTLAALDDLSTNNKIEINDPPVIHRNSDLYEWNEALKDIQPDKDFGAIQVRFIKDTPDHQLCIAWLHNMLDEDEHHADEFAESFFILEGSCECNIGGQIIHLKAGDYLDIPYDTHHSIRSTSPNGGYVKALIQRKKQAA
jgi:mannose-6-phosphate isomerase-like protein (cupin superfamily)